MKPPETLGDRLAQAQLRRRTRHRQRQRRALEPRPGLSVEVDGHALVNFSSNDYLGLAESRLDGASGSGASALVTGYQPVHARLESELADFLGREAAVLTSSGYLANLAAITALAGRDDHIVQDRLAHASLIDAARLSGATLKRYSHADVAAADARLGALEGQGGHRLLVTDGVFSMDGDEAPLQGLAETAGKHEATLIVDDAHGIGVLGAGGGGLSDELGLRTSDIPVLIGTFGKAFGTAGAFIAGSQALIDHIVNEGRSIIYSTALPPAIAIAARKALNTIRDEPQRRHRLHEQIAYFRDGARSRQLELLPSRTPIQPLVLGSERRALDLAAKLETAGFLVAAIRPPTVPSGTSRLRMTLSAGHRKSQIDGLLDALAEAVSE